MSNIQRPMSKSEPPTMPRQVQPTCSTARRAKYDLEERLLNFTCAIIDVVEAIKPTRAGNHIAGQLIRSGTSPAPNYAEAQSAESRNDFVHKMKVALKELRESSIWMRVIQRKQLSNDPGAVDRSMGECEQLIAIFHSSVATAIRNQRTAPPVRTRDGAGN